MTLYQVTRTTRFPPMLAYSSPSLIHHFHLFITFTYSSPLQITFHWNGFVAFTIHLSTTEHLDMQNNATQSNTLFDVGPLLVQHPLSMNTPTSKHPLPEQYHIFAMLSTERILEPVFTIPTDKHAKFLLLSNYKNTSCHDLETDSRLKFQALQ